MFATTIVRVQITTKLKFSNHIIHHIKKSDHSTLLKTKHRKFIMRTNK